MKNTVTVSLGGLFGLILGILGGLAVCCTIISQCFIGFNMWVFIPGMAIGIWMLIAGAGYVTDELKKAKTEETAASSSSSEESSGSESAAAG